MARPRNLWPDPAARDGAGRGTADIQPARAGHEQHDKLKRGNAMFETTLAGSLPKPAWLATPNVLWAPWTLSGEPLFEAKDDATFLAIRRQEEAGLDIVS